MNVLFVSNVYPPEVAPLANRLSEHATTWLADGGTLEVFTDIPNYPEGEIYPGYENRFQKEIRDGVFVTRVPMYIAENKGVAKRTLSYISFMLSVIWFSRRVSHKPDVVVASSPQFFSGLAGYVVAKMKRVPFVLEVRDLWPESIIAVGAVKRNALIRVFEWLERFLYRHADHIVVVTNRFKSFIEKKGIPAAKITVVKNGADLSQLSSVVEPAAVERVRDKFGIDRPFVVSYIGTIGMAHRADILYEAAALCDDPEIQFVVVGSGAERKALEERVRAQPLPNFVLVDKQPRETVRSILAASSASLVHLRKSDLFKTVIPSKIFESMAISRPIILGVEGETAEIIAESESGIPVAPEDAAAIVKAAKYLKNNPLEARRMGANGNEYVRTYHDRPVLARKLWSILENVASGLPPEFAGEGKRQQQMTLKEAS